MEDRDAQASAARSSILYPRRSLSRPRLRLAAKRYRRLGKLRKLAGYAEVS